MKQLTVRSVPDEVADRLKNLSKAKGQSVNATVVEILKGAVDVDERRLRLERYANWTAQDLKAFEEALSDQRRIDDELWQ